MKTARRVLLLAFWSMGGILAAAPAAHAEQFISGDAEFLFRKTIFLANNQTATLTTSGCDFNHHDTVIAVVDASTTPQRPTVAYNDDANGGTCSFVSFTNTSGTSKTYEAVIWNYYTGTISGVTLTTTQTGQANTSEGIIVQALSRIFAATSSAETYQTFPRRPSDGGVPGGDTVLYAINPQVGANSFFDDDSGPNLLSKFTATLTCASCWLVAGNFFANGSPSVGTITALSHNSTDADHDGLSDGMEFYFSTNSSRADSDGDGLSDFVEAMGVSKPNLAGNEGSLIMPWEGTGSDPVHQDVFIEIDWMTTTGAGAHSHAPYTGTPSLESDMTWIFGTDTTNTGRNINVHIDRSQAITETALIGFGVGSCSGVAGYTNFYTFKNDPNFFNPLRATTYHYIIQAHQQADNSATGACKAITSSGVAEIWGNDAIITLASFTAGVGSTAEQRGTNIHEFGHNLTLPHNGNGNTNSAGPNSQVHSSVMNYRYQTGGWGSTTPLRSWSYSRGRCDAAAASCDATFCVPANKASPKKGCTPTNTTGCDCDHNEWNAVNLAFPISATDLTTVQDAMGCGVLKPPIACLGSAAGASVGGHDHWLGAYLLGDSLHLRPEHREFGRRKRDELVARGLREGVDFVFNDETSKVYVRD
jgi:hypothetical protein